MSPRYSFRQSTTKNETTPKKTRKTIACTKSPQLVDTFGNLTLKSPSRKVCSSPLSGSDKENYRDEENINKKRKSTVLNSAKKKLPLGLSNQENVMEVDDTSVASRTRTRTAVSQSPSRKSQPASTPSRQKRYLSNSESNDEEYRCKNSPKRTNSAVKRSSERLKATNSEVIQEEKVDFVELEAAKKKTTRQSSSTTSKREQPSKASLFKENHIDKDTSDSETESDYSCSSTESMESDDGKISKIAKESKKNQVETFEEEPQTSKMELSLRPITKLELDVMEEDALRKAEIRRKRENNPLMKVYPLFHTSALPDVLLKREEQCKQIKNFIKHALSHNSSVHNRSIYISGVPGTGKTACVSKMVQKLQSEKNSIKFKYVYVNGLELIKPDHIFSEIYNTLYPSSRPVSSKKAREKLSKIFSFNDSKRLPILLVVDELDMLCTKSQDVVYDIFDWAATQEARLSVIAIANTLDLPERVLKQRVSSRMGYNRLTFQPYNFEEITHILEYRIKQSGISYKSNAFGLISRKVAAVSGDLRKALEFIRRSIEIAVDNDEEILTVQHAHAAVKEGLQSLPTLFTKSLSSHQECLLRSIVQEIRATSMQELDYFLVYDCYHRNSLVMALEPMEMCTISGLLSSLQRMGFIDIKSYGIVSRRISLKISVDEIDYLLRQMKLSDEN